MLNSFVVSSILIVKQDRQSKDKGKVHPTTDLEGKAGSRGIVLLFL